MGGLVRRNSCVVKIMSVFVLTRGAQQAPQQYKFSFEGSVSAALSWSA